VVGRHAFHVFDKKSMNWVFSDRFLGYEKFVGAKLPPSIFSPLYFMQMQIDVYGDEW